MASLPSGDIDLSLLLPIIDAQSTAREQVVRRTKLGLSAIAEHVDNWADPEQVYNYATTAGILIGAGQVAVANLTEAYLSRIATIITGQRFQPTGVGPEFGAPLRAVPGGTGWDQIYSRVAREYRLGIDDGLDREYAFHRANIRAMQMAEADLGLAFQREIDTFIRFAGQRRERRYIFAYRRIVRPELSQGRVCGLCIAAADRIYYRGDLLPIHNGCNCEVMLITRSTDPGSLVTHLDPGGQLNREALDELYRNAGDNTDYLSLRRTKYVIEQHGEYGPVLRFRDHHFTGPSEVQ